MVAVAPVAVAPVAAAYGAGPLYRGRYSRSADADGYGYGPKCKTVSCIFCTCLFAFNIIKFHCTYFSRLRAMSAPRYQPLSQRRLKSRNARMFPPRSVHQSRGLFWRLSARTLTPSNVWMCPSRCHLRFPSRYVGHPLFILVIYFPPSLKLET